MFSIWYNSTDIQKDKKEKHLFYHDVSELKQETTPNKRNLLGVYY